MQTSVDDGCMWLYTSQCAGQAALCGLLNGEAGVNPALSRNGEWSESPHKPDYRPAATTMEALAPTVGALEAYRSRGLER